MTSKNLFFKMMREDLRRRIWALGLAFLSFFFSMPVLGAMVITGARQDYEALGPGTIVDGTMTAEMKLAADIREAMGTILGTENFLTVMIISCAALVLALTGFLYLHSKKQVDFYGCLPVRREEMFAVKYLDGILIMLSMYLVNLFLCVGVFRVMGGMAAGELFSVGLRALALHTMGFLMIYGLMSLAVLLTGNFFVAVLAGIVLFFYLPLFGVLDNNMMSEFFETNAYGGINFFDKLIRHGSPFFQYNELLGVSNFSASAFIGPLLAAALLALTAFLLYRFRPSEAAGKAMAFEWTMAPVKILIVTPITVAMGTMFWDIYKSLFWGAFGFLFGLLVTHCLIEMIYHFDFRKLLANPVHIAVCAVLALAWIGAYRYDVMGYDRYLPKESEFESASVYIPSLKDWNGDYGLPYQYGGKTVEWRYMDGDAYVKANMRITDYDSVAVLAQAGISEAAVRKEERLKGNSQIYYYEESDGAGGYWGNATVGFRLKNGKTVYRSYYLDLSALQQTLETLYTAESGEYKRGIYPVFGYDPANLTGVYETAGDEIRPVELSKEEIDELFAAYKEELLSLSLSARSKETPVTALRFMTTAERDYIREISARRSGERTDDFRMEDMARVNFFPVYPSFTRTIALLNQAGIEVLEVIRAEDVERIEFVNTDYASMEESQETGDVLSTEAAPAVMETSIDDGWFVWTLENDGSEESLREIREALSASEPDYLTQLNGLQDSFFSVEVRVFRKGANGEKASGEQEYSLRVLKPDEIPDFVRENCRLLTDEELRENGYIHTGISMAK